jgi:hypothetical protein
MHKAAPTRMPALPEIRTGHFLAMCDSTGLIQHAIHSIPDRSHGYCVDDNARALLLACALDPVAEARLPEPLTTRFAAFVQHAWNPDNGRFRNFMSYDRRWLEDVGSEDSHGRTLWALGVCATEASDPARQRWSANLFKSALPVVENFSSPRAWAFTLLGLHAYCSVTQGDRESDRTTRVLAERLCSLFIRNSSETWAWFEDGLAYDNARLSQALIATGLALDNQLYVDVGLKSLRWLMSVQTAPSGCFRPVGSEGFGALRMKPSLFDQQPVEAAATISACLTAHRADGSAEWHTNARRAFDWFWGENDLKVPLISPLTGGCMDGLHPDRANENMGAESVVSYLLGLVEMRQFKRLAILERQSIAAIVARKAAPSAVAARATATNLTAGGHLVSIPISQSPAAASPARSGPSGRSAL